MQGQANHFFRAAPEQIPYAKNRYLNETRRLYSVVQGQLEKRGNKYLLGEKFTIADIKLFPWVKRSEGLGVDLAKEFPAIKAWIDRIDARPGVQEGYKVLA